MAAKKQIEWLVDYYYEIKPECWSASNSKIEDDFVNYFNIELTDRLWKARIRIAASKIGLTSKRLYHPACSSPSWVGMYETVYT